MPLFIISFLFMLLASPSPAQSWANDFEKSKEKFLEDFKFEVDALLSAAETSFKGAHDEPCLDEKVRRSFELIESNIHKAKTNLDNLLNEHPSFKNCFTNLNIDHFNEEVAKAKNGDEEACSNLKKDKIGVFATRDQFLTGQNCVSEMEILKREVEVLKKL